MTLPKIITPPPQPQPIRLPSTAQIDARIRRQTRTYAIWREQYLRRKDHTGHGRWWAGPKPTKPPAFVTLHILPDHTLLFERPPDRRHPDGTVWNVPVVFIHPQHGPLYHLDSLMIMWQQLLRTVPSKRLLIVRGPTPAESPQFKALSQEWVRIPSERGSLHARRRRGYHRWLCAIVTTSPEA